MPGPVMVLKAPNRSSRPPSRDRRAGVLVERDGKPRLTAPGSPLRCVRDDDGGEGADLSGVTFSTVFLPLRPLQVPAQDRDGAECGMVLVPA